MFLCSGRATSVRTDHRLCLVIVALTMGAVPSGCQSLTTRGLGLGRAEPRKFGTWAYPCEVRASMAHKVTPTLATHNGSVRARQRCDSRAGTPPDFFRSRPARGVPCVVS